MLEDFIEVNKLKARILTGFIRKPSGVKCILFFALNKPFLAVFSAKKKLDLKKLALLFKLNESDLREATESESIEVTGYEKGFIPPLSVYGVTIVLDNNLKKFKEVYCFISNERTLQVPLSEIIEMNEELIEADITL